jgi:hypothetical protein
MTYYNYCGWIKSDGDINSSSHDSSVEFSFDCYKGQDGTNFLIVLSDNNITKYGPYNYYSKTSIINFLKKLYRS